ncbi:MAG: FeoC-like transcriptional regulator [Methanosarcinales archaeon]
MTTTAEILCRIEKGGTLDDLAKALDMSKSILVARIEFLVRAGYLCEFHAGNGCGGCGKCETCSVPVPGGRVKMYALTDKGRESIAGLKK